MYLKTFICLAISAVLSLFSVCESEAAEIHAGQSDNSGYITAVTMTPAATSSEVAGSRHSRMPVKRTHHGSFVVRNRIVLNSIPQGVKSGSGILLFPSGKEKAGHHLISLRKLMI